MINFIFHGGGSIAYLNYIKEYILRENFQKKKITILYHAKEKEKQIISFLEDKERFLSMLNMNIQMGSNNINELINQIESSDIIIMKGGDTLLLKETLGKIKNIEVLLNNKIVIGISAGAYIFSKYYYSNNRSCIDMGLGLLEIGLICHYSKLIEHQYKKMKKIINKVIKLEEGQTVSLRF